MGTNNTIVLKGKGHHEEGFLDTVGTPGMAVELAADGKYDLLVVTQAEFLKGAAGLKLLKEDALQGNTVADAYAIADLAFIYEPVPGDHVQLLVKDGETIAVGDNLIPEGSGSGLFVEAVGTETRYVAEALEAVSPSGANALCVARIISS